MSSFRVLRWSLGSQIRRSASALTKHVSRSPISIRSASLATTVAVELDEPIKDRARIPKEAKKILHALASDWDDVADSRDLQVMPMKGAMTNEVYQITWLTGGKSRNVLVRIYGEGADVFFDREDEIRTFECMSRHGQGPRLLGRFQNGRVEEFINVKTLTAAEMRDPEISALIALKLRVFHDLDVPGPKNMLLPGRLRNWLRASQVMCSLEEAEEFHLDDMRKEIDSLENLLSREDQRIGFCHNDLQYGNIMIDKVTRQITIIVERGNSAYLSGLRETYFAEIFLNASTVQGLTSTRLPTVFSMEEQLDSSDLLLGSSSNIDGIDFIRTFSRIPRTRVNHEEGLKRIARFVESFESEAKEIWLVFQNEGQSLSKLIYTAEETKIVTGDESKLRNVQVLRPSAWWYWLRTTERGGKEMQNLTRQLDYEYAGFNPVAYDIANHFCEMTADYHTETPHILDFSKYPELEERRRFVQMYLSSSFSGEEPQDVEVENLLRDIEKYALASHLTWGLWGIISEHVNDIDFDYMEYARQRFQQYWLKKQMIGGH